MGRALGGSSRPTSRRWATLLHLDYEGGFTTSGKRGGACAWPACGTYSHAIPTLSEKAVALVADLLASQPRALGEA